VDTRHPTSDAPGMTPFLILLRSLLAKPLVVALLTVASIIGVHYGWTIDVSPLVLFATPVMVAIGAQGWTAAAQIHADNALKLQAADHAHELKLAVYNCPTCGGAKAAPLDAPGQAGFASFGLMASIAIIATLAMACSLSLSCSSSSPGVKHVETAVVDCTIGELAKLEAVALAFVPLLVEGKLTWKALEDAAVNAGEDVGSCLLADVANAMPAPAKLAGQPVAKPPALEAIDNFKKRVGTTKKIHTAKAEY